MQAAFYSLAGPVLTPDERAFFREAAPTGYILFQRNCADRAQLRVLTDDLRALEGRDDLPILIDQEGGRVARLKPPAWPLRAAGGGGRAPRVPPPPAPLSPGGGPFPRLYAKAPMSAIEAARANAG